MIIKTTSIALPLELKKSISTLIFTGLSVISFCFPFTLGHPQWLVGTIVNTCLFLGAIFLPKKFVLPLVVFPSLGVLARGLIFGPLSMFLVYFLPFIWLGNFILVAVFKRSRSILLSALAKFLFLFIIANIYFKLAIVPGIFVQLMGLNQLFTALVGGTVVLMVLRIYAAKHNTAS